MRKMARVALALSVLGTVFGAELALLEYGLSADVQAISYEEAYQLYDDMRAPYPKYFQDNPKIILAYVCSRKHEGAPMALCCYHPDSLRTG